MKEDHSIAAGLLMYQRIDQKYEFFLVHPGGPFFKNKDAGVWSIPKGLPNTGEDLLAAAIREFREETGLESSGPYHPVGTTRQKGGKLVHCWAFAGSWDGSPIRSNTFRIEWPVKSGRLQEFPEQDKAEWFDYEQAKHKINRAQIIFLDTVLEANLY
jgi:predicted NUDIX family NTP pyrophosphohydrolase